MIAFFDTSVHIDVLRGQLQLGEVLERVHGGPVRLSPVVASELLRVRRARACALSNDWCRRYVPWSHHRGAAPGYRLDDCSPSSSNITRE
jgi:hypothetical protein